MRASHLFAAAALLLAGTAKAQVAIPALTSEELQNFRSANTSYRSFAPQPLTGWEAELRAALATGSLDRAAASLSRRHGLSSAEMRSLIALWLTVDIRQYSLTGSPDVKLELRRQLLALLPSLRRSPLALQAIGESLDALNDCAADDFSALMQGSTDPAADAWTIASAAVCNGNFLRAAAAAPGRAMPALIRATSYGGLDLRDSLPLYRWLTRPEQLARIDEADRPILSAWLHARYARLLFNAGMTEQAVALIESLPEQIRQWVIDPPRDDFTATVDGLPLLIQRNYDQPVALELAAAYALSGRAAQAQALLAAMPRLAAVRRSFDCAWSGSLEDRDSPCGRQAHDDRIDNNVDLLLLDHYLNRPDDDPYPLAETGFASFGGVIPGGATVALRCQVFREERFHRICDGARRSIAYGLRPGAQTRRSDAETARAILGEMPLPGLAEARAESEAEIARVLAALPAPEEEAAGERTSITPTPPAFAELALPEQLRGARPSPVAAPRGTGTLPPGFEPVRFERDGQRAVAISVSQTYDPTGEVSQGGYWVHLSNDGGRSWERPLYTGLAQNFPYVVAETSRLPLLNGDRLDLEVEVAEIDTASIFYPPVATRTRRRAADLYLKIPISELTRDADGDGITDLAERSLLLDRARGDGGTPFIVGSDARATCTAPGPERLAHIGLIERLFSRGSGAIVEPVDRPTGDALSIGDWRAAAASAERPIFIQGNPADYLCLRPNRLMIVYSEADIEALKRFRPDFHAVTVPPVIYNRARDRGYVAYSFGWAGGTYRLRLVGGRWVFEEISSWIT